MKITDEFIVDSIWHWKVDDGLSFKFCSGILEQDYNVIMTASTVRRKFLNYFIKSAGVKLYSVCPSCGEGNLLPRKSMYGYFVGCSDFPTCKYKVSCNKSID